MSSEFAGSRAQGLAFHGVTKRVIYNQKEYTLLSNITGVVHPSQMMALMGLSGCGKTTLLHILSGHIPRQNYEGDIYLDGHRLTKALRKNISLVRQEDVFFSNLTVREQLVFTYLLRFQTSGISHARRAPPTQDSGSPMSLEGPTVAKVEEHEEQLPASTLPSTTSTSPADRIDTTLASLIYILSMEKFADTQIRFISGGEKKRCSIASELLTRPRLLLLDEAASGLDSAAAAALMDTLHSLAEGRSWESTSLEKKATGSTFKTENKDIDDINFNKHLSSGKNESAESVASSSMSPLSIVMSIHQPSPLLLNTFDKVMILAEGHVVFYGTPDNIDTYTRELQTKCLHASQVMSNVWQHSYAMQQNKYCSREICPLDYIIERLSSKVPWLEDSNLGDDECVHGGEGESCEHIDGNSMTYDSALWFLEWPRYVLIHFYDENVAQDEFEEYKSRVGGNEDEEMMAGFPNTSSLNKSSNWDKNNTFHLPYYLQFWVLLRRSLVLASRSSWTTSSSLVETLLIATIVGLCWWNTRYTEKYITDITAFQSFSTTYWFFSSLYVGVMEFFPERLVLQKERDAGSYHLSAYFLAKLVATLPIRIFLPTIYAIIAYPMAFQQDLLNAKLFFSVLGIILLSSQSGESIGLVIGATTPTIEIATTVSTTVSLSMLIFGGFYKQNIPGFLTWLASFSVLNYSFDASVQVVIGSHQDISCDDGYHIPTCYSQRSVSSAYVLEWLQVNTNSPTMNVVYMATIVVSLRVVSYLCLRYISYPPARGYL